MKKNRTRREFLKTTSAEIIGIASIPVLGSGAAYCAENKVKVAVVQNEKAISSRNVCDRAQADLMIKQALFSITGKDNVKDAWISLGLKVNDMVGIKVNCNTWTFSLFNHPELVYALANTMEKVIPANNIIIYERSSSELRRAGFVINKGNSGVRCFGSDEGGGFDPVQNLTEIITKTCTRLINCPTLKCVDGEFAVSLFLKNHIGSLPRGDMPRCHGNTEYCTRVNARPAIRKKTILAMCDGLRGTFSRGKPWYYGGIIMSKDPIAAEYVSQGEINEKRKGMNIKKLTLPSYISKAETSFKLGTCNPSKIDVEKIKI